MNVNSANSVSFGAIKYTCVLPPTAGTVLNKSKANLLNASMVVANPPKRLKNIVENSTFFKTLGGDTDVYVGTQCYDETSKNPFWVFVATFIDPYNPAKKTSDELTFMGHAKDKENWFDKLEGFIKGLPEKYVYLKEQSLESGFIFIGNKGFAIQSEK